MKRPFRAISNTPVAKFDMQVRDLYLTFSKNKTVKDRVKVIGGGYKGSVEEYRNVVLEYWKKYGEKPARSWFELYCDGKDAFDPRFVTDPIWICQILPYFNNMKVRPAYDDKGMYHRLFGEEVKLPETIVKRMGGYYYNGDQERLISRDHALKLLEKENHLIIKPSMDSSGGRGIVFYDRGADDEEKLDAIFRSIRSDFVVQRLVKQHPALARINNDSLNTVRVMTFHFNGEIHVLSAQMRMGGTGSRVDNVTAGGYACAIKEDGWLYDKAVVRKGNWAEKHSNGVLFKDIQVPNYDKITSAAKSLHVMLPHFNIIGWDFAVDEDGEPVLIEFNTRPEQNQIGSGKPTFGDMSDEVFDEVYLKKSLKNSL